MAKSESIFFSPLTTTNQRIAASAVLRYLSLVEWQLTTRALAREYLSDFEVEKDL